MRKSNLASKKSHKPNEQMFEDDSQIEMKQRLGVKLQHLQKEETDLKDILSRLEQDKICFVQEQKQFLNEQNCNFARQENLWPLLNQQYQILSLLGKGGFSEVYKAYDLKNMQYVACKIHQLNPNWSEVIKANYIKHAIRENDIMAQFQHQNIVRLFDTVEIDQNSFCTVLELCEGIDLQTYIKRNKNIPEKDAKNIIKQLLCALKYMYQQKKAVIHYDLKPQNILFQKGEVKISDFGLSKQMEENSNNTRIELTSQGVGTYWYLPPETFECGDNPPQISTKVDIWSVGVIFYELLYNQRPFGHGVSQQQIWKEQLILKIKPVTFPPKPLVSREAQEFIKACLTYNQGDRIDINQANNHYYILKK